MLCRDTILSNCFLRLFWERAYSKRTELALTGTKFFPFKVDSFSKGSSVKEANR